MDEKKSAAKDLLRDGLFEEEANGDFKKAAAAYEELIKRYDQERRYAGTALLRLAEIARKTGDKERARELYARVTREFSDHKGLVAKAREHLPAGGARVGSPVNERMRPGIPARTQEETDELTRLYKLRDQSPDRLDGVDKEGMFPIHRAAQNGWVESLELLLHHKVDLDVKSSMAFTPLQLAVIYGHLTVVDMLIKAGAKLDVTVQVVVGQLPIPVQGLPGNKVSNWSLTHLAVLYKRREILTRLLEAKAPTDIGSAVVSEESYYQDGRSRAVSIVASPLMLAVRRSDQRTLDLLLEGGADINHTVGGQHNALSIAVRHDSEMVEYLLKKGAVVSDDEINGYTLLHRAVMRDKLPVVKLLLEKVTDLEKPVEWGSGKEPMTALELAARRYTEQSRAGAKEVILALLESGAKASQKALVDATKKRQLWLAKALLGAGARVSPEVGKSGPIHEIRTVDIAKLLLDAGADPNQGDQWGYPPLLRVLTRMEGEKDARELVDLLLERGAKTSEISANSRKDVEQAVWRLHKNHKFENETLQYFMEKVVYPELPVDDSIQIVTSGDWHVYDGEKRIFEDAPAPSVLQLFMMAGLLPEQVFKSERRRTPGPSRVRRVPSPPTPSRAGRQNPDWIRGMRIFRKGADGRAKLVSKLNGAELSYEGLPKLEWGDVVEVEFGVGRLSAGSRGLSFGGVWNYLKPVTIVQQVGIWEGKRTIPASRSIFPAYRFFDGRVFDFQPDSQWAHNSTEITVRRGEHVLKFKNENGAIPKFRMIDGDRVELAPLPEIGHNTKGIHMYLPHHPLQTYRMGTAETGLLEILSHLKFRSSIDYSAIEVHRLVDGKRQVMKVDLVGKVRDRKVEDFEKVEVRKIFPERVKTDDVIVLPPRNWAGTNEEKAKREAEHEHLGMFLTHRARWEYDYEEKNR